MSQAHGRDALLKVDGCLQATLSGWGRDNFPLVPAQREKYRPHCQTAKVSLSRKDPEWKNVEPLLRELSMSSEITGDFCFLWVCLCADLLQGVRVVLQKKTEAKLEIPLTTPLPHWAPPPLRAHDSSPPHPFSASSRLFGPFSMFGVRNGPTREGESPGASVTHAPR